MEPEASEDSQFSEEQNAIAEFDYVVSQFAKSSEDRYDLRVN